MSPQPETRNMKPGTTIPIGGRNAPYGFRFASATDGTLLDRKSVV
jgi:hypothetical protein